jgi:hypothetical protein
MSEGSKLTVWARRAGFAALAAATVTLGAAVAPQQATAATAGMTTIMIDGRAVSVPSDMMSRRYRCWRVIVGYTWRGRPIFRTRCGWVGRRW